MGLEVDVDLYKYFGIALDSSTKEIKRAYKRKAKELHPDKNKDDPKENFQKLKEYHDLLLDPVLKNQYDQKIKAKIAAAKRYSELDEERRRLKDILEQREKEAAARWREAQVISQKEKVADRIRKEWEANAEAVAYAAHKEQIKQKEDLQKRKEPTTFVVSLKWNHRHESHIYDKSFLTICLREFGNVLNIIVGKKGSAIAEFASQKEAKDAIKGASSECVGYPDNPLKVSWVGGPPAKTIVPDVAPSQDTLTQPPPDISFDNFETDILAKMARFG